MDSARQDLLGRLARTLKEGQAAVLCVVVRAAGSVPRKSGAKMAVFEDGAVLGTTGGGIVEHRSIELAKAALRGGGSFNKGFNLSNAQAAESGMVCGGQVEIRFERLAPDGRTAEVLEAALRGRRAGQRGWLLFDLGAEKADLNYWDRKAGPLRPEPRLEGEPAARLREESRPCLIEAGGARFFADPVEGPSNLYIFGAGHVARALAPLLARLGFAVTVLDDRSQFASPLVFPDAARTLTVDYGNLEGAVDLRPEDYVVVMTRGHLADLTVLKQVLKFQTSYLGVIGSHKKLEISHKKLLEAGFSEEDLARVHGPIGLAIGAETPDEIAVSIAAEIIAARAGVESGLELRRR